MIPSATYRIQFRNGMTFDRATVIIPYLQQLGISHLYASPIFTAVEGSTHGYDVTDANEIDPTIGGREGFERMVTALQNAGLGLIIDIVPNHMAASLENIWWHDVVEHGEASKYAHHFDIDWSMPLTLPFLGDTFEAELEAGKISIKQDPDTSKSALAYHDTFYPLTPASDADQNFVLQNHSRAEIAKLHDRQPYRLMSWRDAASKLSYRRFFEITGLVGVRVEDTAVFNDTHHLILELVRQGKVQGLRVDHIDGLADPKSYLERLRLEVGPDCYITVEKILGDGEDLPIDWPVSGTTGYEFIVTLSEGLVDGSKLEKLRTAYENAIGKPVDLEEELRVAKLLMVDRNFAGEVSSLLRLAVQIASTASPGSFLTEPVLMSALRELLVAFPVYRTYGTTQGMPTESQMMLSKVMRDMRDGPNPPDDAALKFFEAILLGDVEQKNEEYASAFRTRFQQLTGPLMAKAVEDTLFFRQHMALALNEVGAHPLKRNYGLDHFHEDMQRRFATQPDALSSTSTHDTKRGEDARARLYTLTEAPEVWARAVARWRSMNSRNLQTLDDGPAPEPATEWMIYQALAGVWPTDLHIEDEAGMALLEDRFVAYLTKALREAKQRTNWGDENKDYENAVTSYARALLSRENQIFLRDFTDTLKPFMRAGLVNSLTQTIVKLTAPGVPDIYQGSEGLNFSLVDPDNRLEPDFNTLQDWLMDKSTVSPFGEQAWQTGRTKQQIIATILKARKNAPDLYGRGSYVPLVVTGPLADHFLAFSRIDGDNAVVVVLPRLFYKFSVDEGPLSFDRFEGTKVATPASLAGRHLRNLITGETLDVNGSIDLGRSFLVVPYLLLETSPRTS